MLPYIHKVPKTLVALLTVYGVFHSMQNILQTRYRHSEVYGVNFPVIPNLAYQRNWFAMVAVLVAEKKAD